ncbi:hypothetical protein MCEMSEM18_03516 [Comamonadaceae bacterium]
MANQQTPLTWAEAFYPGLRGANPEVLEKIALLGSKIARLRLAAQMTISSAVSQKMEAIALKLHMESQEIIKTHGG